MREYIPFAVMGKLLLTAAGLPVSGIKDIVLEKEVFLV